MTDTPDYTSVPVLLVGGTAAEAAHTFGQGSADTWVASHEDILTGSQDAALSRATFIGLGRGEHQVPALRHILDLASSRSKTPGELAVEIRDHKATELVPLGEMVAQNPDVRVGGVAVVGDAPCLIFELGAPGDAGAVSRRPERPTRHTRPDGRMPTPGIDEFRAGAEHARLRVERDRVGHELEVAKDGLRTARKRLAVARDRAEAQQKKLTELRRSRWVKAALRLRRVTRGLAQRLHLSPSATLVVVAVLAVCLSVGLLALMVTVMGSSAVTGAVACAALAVLATVAGFMVWLLRVTRRLQRLDARSRRENKRVMVALGRVEKRLGAVDVGVREQVASLQSVAAEAHDALVAGLEDNLSRSAQETRTLVDGMGQALATQPQPTWFHAFEQRYNRRNVIERRQTEAAMNLFALTPVEAGVPSMGGWAASPDVLLFLMDELLELKPSIVLECGSGVSTLWFALMVRHHGLPTRVVALEHDAHFASQTRAVLARHGVAHLAEVRHAPLSPSPEPGHDTPWYDTTQIRDLQDVGLVFVDGPPTDTGPLARMPAASALRSTLAPRCTVVLDDWVRAEEKAVAEKWREQLPDFDFEGHNFEKGAAVFRRRA